MHLCRENSVQPNNIENILNLKMGIFKLYLSRILNFVLFYVKVFLLFSKIVTSITLKVSTM